MICIGSGQGSPVVLTSKRCPGSKARVPAERLRSWEAAGIPINIKGSDEVGVLVRRPKLASFAATFAPKHGVHRESP